MFSFRSPYSINVYRWKETYGVFVKTLPFNWGNRCSSVSIDTNHGPDIPRFKSRQGKYIFSCTKISGSAPGPTLPIFNGHLDSFLGVQKPGREFHHSPPSTAKVKNE